MNLLRHPGLLDRLAAEYALGTLRGGARRRLQGLARQDATIDQALQDWQRRLEAIVELAPAQAPPSTVWQAIEEQLGLAAAPAQITRQTTAARVGALQSWFQNLNFWRGWSFVATAAAAIMLFVAIRPPAPTTQGTPGTVAQGESRIAYVAVLNDTQSHAMMLVTWDETHSTMTLRRLVDTPLAADKSMQLWGLPTGGHPVSLGVLPTTREVSMNVTGRPKSFPALAISVEPKGGSPNSQRPDWAGGLQRQAGYRRPEHATLPRQGAPPTRTARFAFFRHPVAIIRHCRPTGLANRWARRAALLQRGPPPPGRRGATHLPRGSS